MKRRRHVNPLMMPVCPMCGDSELDGNGQCPECDYESDPDHGADEAKGGHDDY